MLGALAAAASPPPTLSAPTTARAADLFRRLPLFHVIDASTARTLAVHISKLVRYNKKVTLSAWEVQPAVRLLLPDELAKHAVSEGHSRVQHFRRGPMWWEAHRGGPGLGPPTKLAQDLQ